MTRRTLLRTSAVVLALLVPVLAAARPAEKPAPLDVTYYYLPG